MLFRSVQGTVLPVVNLRRRFGLPDRPVELSDQLIIIRCAMHRFVLITDTECEVRECAGLLHTETCDSIPDLPFPAAVIALPDGLVLLQNPELLLSPGETESIDALIGCE